MPTVTAPPESIQAPEAPAYRALPDGRIVLRHTRRCPVPDCAATLVTYTDPGGTPLVRDRGCVLCWFRSEAARIRRDGLYTPSPRAAFVAELHRFAAEYQFPEIARRLAHLLTPPEPSAHGRLFDPGATLVERPLAEVAGALIARHTRGDWGEFNGDPGPLSEAEAWAPALFSQAVANDAAIVADGVVLSRHAHRLGSPKWIDIATWIKAEPGQDSETIVRFSDTHHEVAIDATG